MMKSVKLVAVTLVVMVFSAMKVETPKKIIFFGDSITQLGVNPGGYITLLQDQLKKQGKSANYELVGAGIGGNKIYDLFLRLDRDVLSKKPDLVVIYVGINDVWHKQSFGTGTDPDKFELFYSTVIEKIQAAGAQVVLCSPAVIGERTDFSNQQDGDLNRYSSIVRKLAAKHKCSLVDLRKLFLEHNLKHNPDNKESGILTTDRVHLNAAGNKLVADELAKVIF